MLKIIFKFLMLSICMTTYAQIKLPALSPSVEISQRIGLTTATLSYSRPSLRGRDLFGENGILVLGEKWRTGANATTEVRFNKDIEINGQALSKGAYALLTTPKETSWVFHFYQYEKGPYTKFLDEEPILEITVPIQQLNYSLETFSLHFDGKEGGHNLCRPISLTSFLFPTFTFNYGLCGLHAFFPLKNRRGYLLLFLMPRVTCA